MFYAATIESCEFTSNQSNNSTSGQSNALVTSPSTESADSDSSTNIPLDLLYEGCDGLMELISTIPTDGLAKMQLMGLALSGNLEICNSAIKQLTTQMEDSSSADSNSTGATPTVAILPSPTSTAAPVTQISNTATPEATAVPTPVPTPEPTIAPTPVPKYLEYNAIWFYEPPVTKDEAGRLWDVINNLETAPLEYLVEDASFGVAMFVRKKGDKYEIIDLLTNSPQSTQDKIRSGEWDI